MEETALSPAAPAAETVAPQAEKPAAAPQDAQTPEGQKPEGEEAPKKEKTPEEREIARLRRRVDNLTRRLYQAPGLQQQPIERDNQAQPSDNEPLTLSRAELQKLIDQEAARRAPTISQQQAEIEHRQQVVEKLASTWGQERFDALASELDDAFGGLADHQGKPKAATEAIFESRDPAGLIEYLADPENAAEAQALARMSPVRAGARVAELSAQIAAKKAEAKQRSKAAAPLSADKPSGAVSTKRLIDMDMEQFIAKRNEQLKARRR